VNREKGKGVGEEDGETIFREQRTRDV